MKPKKDYGYKSLNIKKEMYEKIKSLVDKTGLRREVLICQMIAHYEEYLRGKNG
jgi:hypothetical protein